jgi:hypothetical protein
MMEDRRLIREPPEWAEERRIQRKLDAPGSKAARGHSTGKGRVDHVVMIHGMHLGLGSPERGLFEEEAVRQGFGTEYNADECFLAVRVACGKKAIPGDALVKALAFIQSVFPAPPKVWVSYVQFPCPDPFPFEEIFEGTYRTFGSWLAFANELQVSGRADEIPRGGHDHRPKCELPGHGDH